MEDGGAFRVTVTARNPQPFAVVVRTPPELREPPGYRYYLWSPSGMANGGRLEVSPDECVFAPGQTRRAVFDFLVAGAARADGLPPAGVVLRPDTYVVQGSLDGGTATREGLVLGP